MARTRRIIIATVPAAVAAVLAALPVAPAVAATPPIRVEGALIAYAASVPVSAAARVQAVDTGSGKTVVTLHVRGLAPNTAYGAHAHVNTCGATRAAAGPHYQHVVAPFGQAADVAYANADNEIWLDLGTDPAGNGAAQTVVDWQFRSDGANSVVVHAHATATGPNGSAGTAGPRLACLSVDF